MSDIFLTRKSIVLSGRSFNPDVLNIEILAQKKSQTDFAAIDFNDFLSIRGRPHVFVLHLSIINRMSLIQCLILKDTWFG